MSEREAIAGDVDFQRRLEALRWKIDALPEPQRPHLAALADIIEKQHRRLHRREMQAHDGR